MVEKNYFPFSAIVDQTDMKDALVCNAIHPGIGGVLISGTRGTAKSTAARSLAHLLPPIRAVADCPFNCPPTQPERQCAECATADFTENDEAVTQIPTPFVNLPLGATEDRVLGTIDLETAIQDGERSFEPGLLARANRGILYVDEVNLLADHLVDILLDVVAMGINRVEREGISFEHPANVILVGTMNPEEGELRPQLLDRFGLFVDIDDIEDPEERKKIVRRRTRYDEHPERLMAEWATEEQELADRIRNARKAFDEVRVEDELLDLIVNICSGHDVDGLRADIIIHRTARALAALEGTQAVEEDHVRRAAELALPHRSKQSRSQSTTAQSQSRPTGHSDSVGTQREETREKPPDEELTGFDHFETGSPETDAASRGDDDEPMVQDDTTDDSTKHEGSLESLDDTRVFPITDGITPPDMDVALRDNPSETSTQGAGNHEQRDGGSGLYYRARRPQGRPQDLALDATVRAAAPHQVSRYRDRQSGNAVRLRPSDVRVKERLSRQRNLVVFVVDSSGSMGAYHRMSTVKGAVLSVLQEAYQQRDYVSLIGFRGDTATVLLPPTRSVPRAAHAVEELPTGGRTPLGMGLTAAVDLVNQYRRKQRNLNPLVVLMTDGRSNYSPNDSNPIKEALNRADRVRENGLRSVCFDTETGPVRAGIVEELAARMGARYYRLDDLAPRQIPEAVRANLTR